MTDDLYYQGSLEIQVMAPVHIGTGLRLQKINYLPTRDSIVVLDENKIIKWLASDPTGRLADEYVDLAIRGQSLEALINRYRKPYEELEAYKIQTRIPKESRIRDFHTFIRRIDHQAYLPGSSFKGSLRSALLRGSILEDNGLRMKMNRDVDSQALRADPGRGEKTASEEIQASVFVPARPPRAKYSNYDFNRLFIFHDSDTFPRNSLEIVEVRVLSSARATRLETKFVPKRDFPMALFVEVLPGESQTVLPFAIQQHLLSHPVAQEILNFNDGRKLVAYLPEYCRAAANNLINQEIEFYSSHGHPLAGWFEDLRDQSKRLPEGAFFLPIGWGSGYDAKTITDLMESGTFKIVCERYKNTQGLGRPGNNPRSAWLGPRLSPKSRKVVLQPDGTTYLPMGWIRVQIRMDETPPGKTWKEKFKKGDEIREPIFPDYEIKSAIKTSISDEESKGKTSKRPVDAPINVDEDRKSIAVSPTMKSIPKTIINTFTDPPQIGDRFNGIVFDKTRSSVFLTIPGIEETVAYALIAAADLTSQVRDEEKILCEVISLEQDAHQAWIVRCNMLRRIK